MAVRISGLRHRQGCCSRKPAPVERRFNVAPTKRSIVEEIEHGADYPSGRQMVIAWFTAVRLVAVALLDRWCLAAHVLDAL